MRGHILVIDTFFDEVVSTHHTEERAVEASRRCGRPSIIVQVFSSGLVQLFDGSDWIDMASGDRPADLGWHERRRLGLPFAD